MKCYPKHYIDPRQLSPGESTSSTGKDLFAVYYPGSQIDLEQLDISDEEKEKAKEAGVTDTWQMLVLRVKNGRNMPNAPVSGTF